MAAHTDSLRGYAFHIHQRDGFKCRYCGADGTKSFDTRLTLSWDHLLPKGNPNRDNHEYIVTACDFYNATDNHYFEQIKNRGLTLEGLTRDQLVAQRLPYVMKTRQSYREFWSAKLSQYEST